MYQFNDNVMTKTLSAIAYSLSCFLRLPVMTYKETDFASDVAKLVLNESWDSVEGDRYHITVENKQYAVTFWTANKMYAYFSSGTIKDKVKEKEASWESEMPCREYLFAVENKFRNAVTLFQLQARLDYEIAKKNIFGKK